MPSAVEVGSGGSSPEGFRSPCRWRRTWRSMWRTRSRIRCSADTSSRSSCQKMTAASPRRRTYTPDTTHRYWSRTRAPRIRTHTRHNDTHESALYPQSPSARCCCQPAFQVRQTLHAGKRYHSKPSTITNTRYSPGGPVRTCISHRSRGTRDCIDGQDGVCRPPARRRSSSCLSDVAFSLRARRLLRRLVLQSLGGVGSSAEGLSTGWRTRLASSPYLPRGASGLRPGDTG